MWSANRQKQMNEKFIIFKKKINTDIQDVLHKLILSLMTFLRENTFDIEECV